MKCPEPTNELVVNIRKIQVGGKTLDDLFQTIKQLRTARPHGKHPQKWRIAVHDHGVQLEAAPAPRNLGEMHWRLNRPRVRRYGLDFDVALAISEVLEVEDNEEIDPGVQVHELRLAHQYLGLIGE
jgi:hypothetical protein